MLYYSLVAAAQVLLETLPISSSSHVILLERLFGISRLSPYIVYLLHVPTVCVLAFFFRTQIISLVRSMQRSWRIVVWLGFLISIVDSITILFFIFLQHVPVVLPLYVGIMITAMLLFSLKFFTGGGQHFGVMQAVVLGCAQSVALLPGISRFATVYSIARILGISHRRAFEITWLCAVPLFVAPTLLVIYKGVDISYFVDPLFFVIVCGATILSYYLLQCVAWLAAHNYLWMLSIYMVVPFILSLILV